MRLWDLGPGTRVLATVPPHHLYGLLFGVMVPFMGGGSVVRTTPLHAETIAAQARSHQANVLSASPRICTRWPRFRPAGCRRWRASSRRGRRSMRRPARL